MVANYGEIVRKDCYKMNNWPNNFFDVIIDIGANVGVFVLYAHMRHPKAKIFAYEPCKETYKKLLENTYYLDNLKCFNKALGDGQPLTFYDTGWSDCNLFFKDSESKPKDPSISESYSVPSCTLSEVFEETKPSGKYLIKIDCEGGERFIFKEPLDIIQKSHAFCLEVHFPPLEKSSSYERFKNFPPWKSYNTWIYDNFSKTHSILYHQSDRKRRGAGVYCLKLIT